MAGRETEGTAGSEGTGMAGRETEGIAGREGTGMDGTGMDGMETEGMATEVGIAGRETEGIATEVGIVGIGIEGRDTEGMATEVGIDGSGIEGRETDTKSAAGVAAAGAKIEDSSPPVEEQLATQEDRTAVGDITDGAEDAAANHRALSDACTRTSDVCCLT